MLNLYVLILLIMLKIYLFALVLRCLNAEIHPEFDLTLEEKVRSHGYPIEAHQVETEDDYLISLYHIPYGFKKHPFEDKNKSAVLIIHGLGGCPHNFVVLGPQISAPYYFADRGMDVWLFSSRGFAGSFEKNHKTLDWNKNEEYWAHGLHEISIYDLSASIDFVLNYTGQKKVSLIGHSAGGNEMFCLFSERPEYNDKVKVSINWASSPIIKRLDYPLMWLGLVFTDFFKAFAKRIGMVEFMPVLHRFKPFMKATCADPQWQKTCTMVTWVIGSHKSYLQRPNDVQLVVSNFPRIPSRLFFHFMDNINNGSFRKYDFGPKENMKYYGQRYPPKYNLSAARVPTAFFIGPSDSEITKPDILEVISHLPNAILLYEVPFSKFTHLDFIFGTNASDLVYEPTLRLMQDIDKGKVHPPIKIPADYDYEDYY